MNRIINRLALLLVALLLCVGCGGPPQVLGDEECFKTLDALWTAVTARSPELLEQTATDLSRLHTTGKLSDAGHHELEEMIKKARAKEWETAARNLKVFIQGQRKPVKT